MINSLPVAKNTIIYTSALVMQKVLSFVYFVVVARFLSVGEIGKYTFALSFTAIFAIIIDFGLGQLLTREVAKDRRQTQKLLANILSLKLILAVLVYGLVAVMVNVLKYPELTRQLVYLSGLVMILDALTLNFYAVLRGWQNLTFESLGAVGNQVVVMFLGLVFLNFGWSLHWLIMAYLGGSLFNLLFSLSKYQKTVDGWPAWQLDWQFLKPLLVMALPFAMAGLFARLYGYADIVLLSKLAGDQAVGWYSVAYKLTFAFQFIPLAFMAAFLPAMSNFYVLDKARAKQLLEEMMFYLLLIVLPIAGGIFVLAPEIIVTLYGPQYLPAATALRILITSLLFVYLNFPFGTTLNACDRQQKNMYNLAWATVASVGLNLLLIPIFGFVGSAWAALGTGIILMILNNYQVRKFLAYNWLKILGSGFKILAVTSLMMLVVAWLKLSVWWPLAVVVGVVFYGLSIWWVKIIKTKDLEFLYRLIKKEKSL
ncbi:MAG: flippase [Candidatus Buchananbacteria bacterium]